MRTLLALLLSSCGVFAQEKYVTLTLAAGPASQSSTNAIGVGSGEILHLVSLTPESFAEPYPHLLIEKGGNRAFYARGPLFAAGSAIRGTAPLDPLVVVGPAVVTILNYGGMATFKITPDQYPPNKTVVVPGGPGGANVTMECSTNLVHWTPADNGAYTNLPGVKFFRIKLDRIQP